MPERATRIENGKPVISERTFTAQVITMARVYNWRVAHFRSAMDRHGRWKTAVQGDGAGFPDLLMVRNQRLIFAELKTDGGRLSSEQEKWLVALKLAQRAVFLECYVWRPKMIEEIERILK